tara:strand:- start:382 stop:969 length:588 start_codon:yes stop_codon:yes gene_type:complete
MEFEVRLMLSGVSALFGFFLSQSFNILKYLRRPRFEVCRLGNGVISSYSGDPPETPAEVTFGFRLTNVGRNPALNTRVFVSDLKSANREGADLDDGVFEFSELKRPIDIIPPGQSVLVVFGRMTSENRYLDIEFERGDSFENDELIEADTRDKKVFSGDFYISCDNIDSFARFNVLFNLENDFVEDYIFHEIERN